MSGPTLKSASAWVRCDGCDEVIPRSLETCPHCDHPQGKLEAAPPGFVTKAQHDRALSENWCPACHADAGAPCTRSDGSAMGTCHLGRFYSNGRQGAPEGAVEG